MDTFLSPLGDYGPVAEFCGVKDPTRADFRRSVDVAAGRMRSKVGPVLMETLTHSTPGGAAIVTPFRVRVVVSSVGVDVADLTTDPHHLDPSHGGQVVRRTSGQLFPACTITYASGWEYYQWPPELEGAGFELARHLWRTQLGNQRVTPAGGDQPDVPGAGWLWPRQALQLIDGWELTPLGFA